MKKFIVLYFLFFISTQVYAEFILGIGTVNLGMTKNESLRHIKKLVDDSNFIFHSEKIKNVIVLSEKENNYPVFVFYFNEKNIINKISIYYNNIDKDSFREIANHYLNKYKYTDDYKIINNELIFVLWTFEFKRYELYIRYLNEDRTIAEVVYQDNFK